MKLSERLAIHAQDCALASRDNNDMVIGFHQMNDLAEALAEAAQLARRVEEAQVCELISIRPAPLPGLLPVYQMSPLDGLGWPSTCGQRVRLVREG